MGITRDWSLGYARHDGRWGLLVRLACGNRRNHLHDRVDTWFFNDAPRFIKTRAALPELIEGLVAVSEKTADKLIKKVPEVTGLAAAVTQHFEKRKKWARHVHCSSFRLDRGHASRYVPGHAYPAAESGARVAGQIGKSSFTIETKEPK